MDVWVVVHSLHDNERIIGAGDSFETALSICQRFIQKRRIPALLLEPEATERDIG